MLAWIRTRSGVAVPIPGFKTVSQVEENAGAVRFGPLPAGTMEAVDDALGRTAQNAT